MSAKRCSKCGDEKPTEAFNKKGNKTQPWCRECNREKSKEYYNSNRERHKEATTARKNRLIVDNLAKFRELKSSCRCSLCPEAEPICLDFHHTKDKEQEIIRAIHRGWSWDRVLLEMKKCVVLCANCHRKVHAGLLSVEGIPLYETKTSRNDGARRQ